jgi:hypothetical protein
VCQYQPNLVVFFGEFVTDFGVLVLEVPGVGEQVRGLAACHGTSEGHLLRHIPVLLGWVDIRACR